MLGRAKLLVVTSGHKVGFGSLEGIVAVDIFYNGFVCTGFLYLALAGVHSFCLDSKLFLVRTMYWGRAELAL